MGTATQENKHQQFLEAEKEIKRLKSEIFSREKELNDLRLELGKAAIKLENHKA